RPWNRDTFPDLPGAKLENRRACTADVVGVAMSERDGVQPANAGVAQDWCDNPVAHIEAAAAWQPAGVDQQRRAARKLHERRILLPDVDKGNVEAGVPHRTNQSPGLGDDPQR